MLSVEQFLQVTLEALMRDHANHANHFKMAAAGQLVARTLLLGLVLVGSQRATPPYSDQQPEAPIAEWPPAELPGTDSVSGMPV